MSGIRSLGYLRIEATDVAAWRDFAVKVLGMVNSADGFGDQPKVINGFSDLMVEVFGDAGKHARSAVGMAGLPVNIPVEIEMVLVEDLAGPMDVDGGPAQRPPGQAGHPFEIGDDHAVLG